MDTRLRIKLYKQITDEICLTDFSPVNYLVGVNGSGKSSILSALSFLKNATDSKIFFTENSVVEFTIDEKERHIQWQPGIQPGDVGTLDVMVMSMAQDEVRNHNQYSDKNSHASFGPQYGNPHIGKQGIENLNDTLKSLSVGIIEPQRTQVEDAFETPELFFTHNTREIDISFIAEGFKKFNTLKSVFPQHLLFRYERGELNVDAIIILIEEVENHLHPSLQKRVPKELENAILGFPIELRSKVFFFITTHSPFVIGAAAPFPNQKTYLLTGGMLCDFQLKEIPESAGYQGKECATIVGQMLGADVTDLGYPENYCILEEHSLQLILEDAKSKGLLRDIVFISGSGVSKTIDFNDTMLELERFNTLLKCNPFYSEKYLMVIDNSRTLEEAVSKRITKARAKLGDRFIELTKESLEDYYKKFDEPLYKQFQIEIGELGEKLRGNRRDFKRELGKLKASFAELITQKVHTNADFIKLFEGELNILLRS